MSHVLDRPKEYLLTNPEKIVDPKLEKKFLTLLNRRLLGWPVAYITKVKEFHKHKFYVDKHVLIPRPETEGLVDLALKAIKNVQSKPIRILDVGTGSGNIIISLAKALRRDPELNSGLRFQYFASDISPKAIAVAKKNAKKHKVKIKFADGNLLEPWGKQNFDVIVANLPYLAKLVDKSTKHEPIGALIAAKKGLKLYEELFKQISYGPSLRKQGSKIKIPHQVRDGTELPEFILLEIGKDQGGPIKKLAKNLLPEYACKIHKDLFGRTRYAMLQCSR